MAKENSKISKSIGSFYLQPFKEKRVFKYEQQDIALQS